MRNARHRRLAALEKRRTRPALRIVREIFAPSAAGPHLVGAMHRPGPIFERQPDETEHQFRTRAGLAHPTARSSTR